ncbi:MAG: PEP-CTERM sorting domain-containing protein [Terracidiphilus sp.]
MRTLRGFFLLCALMALCLSTAVADSISGTLTVDNGFYAYLSTSATSQGTLLTKANNWRTPVSFSNIALTPGVTYYLQIAAFNQGYVGGVLGSFSLSGTSFAFENGAQRLDTNTADWTYSYATANTANYPGPDVASGWGSSALTPGGYGTNGVSPWGTIAGIDSSAQWLWDKQNAQYGNSSQPQLLFETALIPTPEPGSMLLYGSGLLIMAGMGRRRLAKR